MTMRMPVVLTASLTVLAAVVGLTAPGPSGQTPLAQGTERPGQATRGSMWIENRGRGEAIPVVAPDPLAVVVQNVATARPMPVRLAGDAPGLPVPPIAVRPAFQVWEYQTLVVPADVSAPELTNLLRAPGNEGWETAGIQIPSGGNVLVVLKRPLTGAS